MVEIEPVIVGKDDLKDYVGKPAFQAWACPPACNSCLPSLQSHVSSPPPRVFSPPPPHISQNEPTPNLSQNEPTPNPLRTSLPLTLSERAYP